MREIVAVIVGIEKYSRSGIDISSPFANAMTAARHLLGMGAKAKNIHLLVNRTSSSDGYRGEVDIERLRAEGVTVLEEPTKAAILNELASVPAGIPPDSRLFLYWCGHGYAGAGDRILLCSDYDAARCDDRTFNATRRFRRLGSHPEYTCFTEQIFLVDVCARYSDVIDPDQLSVSGQRHARQVAAFATREGGYSRGGFSDVALDWLGRQKTWPDTGIVLKTLLPELDRAKLKPFTLDADDEATTIAGRRFGGASARSYPPHVLEMQALLASANLSSQAIRNSYEATLADLRLPVEGDPDLVQMLAELAEMFDAEDLTDISDAFLQFVTRLSFDPEGAPLKRWLEELPAPLAYRRNSVRERLAAEADEKLLIVEIDGNERADPSLLSAFACTRAGKWLNVPPFQRQLADWDELSAAVNSALDSMVQKGVQISEIQFVVRPFLFHHEFHKIPRPNEGELGEHYVVLLRDKYRAYQDPPPQAVLAYKQAMAKCSPDKIKLVQIPSEATKLPQMFSGDQGFCYAGFICGPDPHAETGRRDILRRVVLRGVGYAYWLQKEPACGGDWTIALKKYLLDALAGVGQLKDLPSWIRNGRQECNELAVHGALLWDDPDFKPFLKLSSPSRTST
ncbi:hypothetical protein XH96_32190 [Bradyrhizobium sp. CCBAU 51765]|nr:hypothetical protein XH96_32190 [Bradyrhizobium sp. CCBAU 51765]